MLELKAVFLALQGFDLSGFRSSRVSISLCLFSLRLLTWCRQKGVTLSASHIPGHHKLVADFLSRRNVLLSEWCINHFVFDHIVLSSKGPQVDHFAATLNHRLPRYCARSSDPVAWVIGAYSIRWSDFLGYASPPPPSVLSREFWRRSLRTSSLWPTFGPRDLGYHPFGLFWLVIRSLFRSQPTSFFNPSPGCEFLNRRMATEDWWIIDELFMSDSLHSIN